MSLSTVLPVAVSPAVTLPASADGAAPSGDNGFSFDDLIDIVNPLQHIPVVSTLYRAITGDTIKTFPKLAGDTLFGGITGLASSMADTVFTSITGKSVGDTVLAFAESAFSPAAPASPDAPAAPQAASIAAPAGEDLGDRIVDWFENIFSSAGSTAAPAPVTVSPPVATIASQVPAPPMLRGPVDAEPIVVPGQEALITALNRSGVGQDVVLRAADAYRRTITVSTSAADAALH